MNYFFYYIEKMHISANSGMENEKPSIFSSHDWFYMKD